MNEKLCEFKASFGEKCNRTAAPYQDITGKRFINYCIFHHGYHLKSNEELDLPYIPLFQKQFDEILNSGDGKWIGFVFPTNIIFPKLITFVVDARECQINLLELDKIIFKESVDFSYSIFKKSLIIKSTEFENSAKFERCQFKDTVDFLNVQFKGTTSFTYADFSDRTLLRANFHQNANFNEAIFRDVTVFTGWQNINISISEAFISVGSISGGSSLTIKQQIRSGIQKVKRFFSQSIKQIKSSLKNQRNKVQNHTKQLIRKYAKSDPNVEQFKMFEAETQFQGVTFFKPDQVHFNQVTLSKVHFKRTNLRGVRFIGVDWWQPHFKRNGIYDEVFIGKSSDGPYRRLNLPILEETCRNARIALEENKNFNIASDFYIAEMEAVRQQQNIFERHLFSVTALYRFVSKYGTSVGTSIRVLTLIYLLHVVSSLYIHSSVEITPLLDQFMTTALRSIKVLLLMQPETITNSQSWLDVGLRVAGTIQIAMVAIAFRARIKRH